MSVRGKCRGCDAEIRWVTLTTGKKMPLDPSPGPGGNVLVDGPVGAVLGRAALEEARSKGTLLYRPHFDACPKAVQFRKRKEAP